MTPDAVTLLAATLGFALGLVAHPVLRVALATYRNIETVERAYHDHMTGDSDRDGDDP